MYVESKDHKEIEEMSRRVIALTKKYNLPIAGGIYKNDDGTTSYVDIYVQTFPTLEVVD